MRRTDFDNGYGISVIRERNHNAHFGLFEVAVMHGECLCYRTPITDDVLRFQSITEVSEISKAIEALPPNPLCTHKRPRPDKEDQS
jgi:hypothetical protein